VLAVNAKNLEVLTIPGMSIIVMLLVLFEVYFVTTAMWVLAI
jgi:hypothetical protein